MSRRIRPGAEGETKLLLDDVPTVLALTHAPAILPGRYAPRLCLFYLPTMAPRCAQWVVDWDRWVAVARELGLTAAMSPRGYVRVCWRDRAAWEAQQEAIAFLKRREAGA